MNNFREHFRNTIFGFIVGGPLMAIIHPLNYWVISAIQCIFFAGFYAILDKAIKFLSRKNLKVVKSDDLENSY